MSCAMVAEDGPLRVVVQVTGVDLKNCNPTHNFRAVNQPD